jgi:hypothetical protein
MERVTKRAKRVAREMTMSVILTKDGACDEEGEESRKRDDDECDESEESEKSVHRK